MVKVRRIIPKGNSNQSVKKRTGNKCQNFSQFKTMDSLEIISTKPIFSFQICRGIPLPQITYIKYWPNSVTDTKILFWCLGTQCICLCWNLITNRISSHDNCTVDTTHINVLILWLTEFLNRFDLSTLVTSLSIVFIGSQVDYKFRYMKYWDALQLWTCMFQQLVNNLIWDCTNSSLSQTVYVGLTLIL